MHTIIPIHHDSPETIVRCTTTADFLAALPRLTGFSSTNSLFVVFFSGKRATGSMRVTLPAADAGPSMHDFVHTVADLVRRARQAHGRDEPALVISSSVSFAEAGRTPWRSLALHLESRLERDGIGVRALCCIAPDGWACYRDSNTPQHGHSLDVIRSSHAASPIPVPTLEDLGALRPEASADERQAMLVALKHVPRLGRREGEIAAMLVGSAELGTAELARVIRSAGSTAGSTAILDQLLATSSAARTPSSMSSRAIGRLRLAAERLFRAARLAPEPYAVGTIACCAAAWWLRGMQSVADQQISLAIALDPEHRFANTVAEMIENNATPPMRLAA